MPAPRTPRPAADAARLDRDDSPANLARMRAELGRRLDHQHWVITCLNEARRRVWDARAPGQICWLNDGGDAAVSLEKIAAGERPPPGLEAGWYPPGHPLLPTAQG